LSQIGLAQEVIESSVVDDSIIRQRYAWPAQFAGLPLTGAARTTRIENSQTR
jgi:hypothetical protein